MDNHREKKMQALREQIEYGEYLVNPTVVADAILRRIRGLHAEPEPELVLAAGAHGWTRERIRTAEPMSSVAGGRL